MSKQLNQSVVKYKPLYAEKEIGFKTEGSLNTIITSGSYLVQINHNGKDVGLPIEDCGEEHYIVGILLVTDSGTNVPKQNNRAIGQVLILTSRENKETKAYTRTFAEAEWGRWRTLGYSASNGNITTTDELVFNVEELITETEALQVNLANEIIRAKEVELANTDAIHTVKLLLSNDKKKICKAYTNEDFSGVYCSSVSNGEIRIATASINSLLIPVNGSEIYKITSENLTGTTIPFYSTKPTIENYKNVFVGTSIIRGDSLLVPEGSSYMLVTLNGDTATADIKQIGWADAILSSSLSNMPVNIGSEYIEAVSQLKNGVALDNRVFFSTNVRRGISLEFIAESEMEIEYRILTQDGKTPTVTASYKSNILYREQPTVSFIDALNVGKNWGLFVTAAQATTDTPIRFRARLIKDDSFSLQNSIDRIDNKVGSLDTKIDSSLKGVNEVMIIPNNNNYIKNWEVGNKLVVRLYIENKEEALTDKLYIRQIFKLSETNYGFNFGNSIADWALTLAPNVGAFEYYETTSYTVNGIKNKYGKIAIRMNWDGVEWGNSTTVGTGVLSESNLEDIVFDYTEFSNPLTPYPKLPDNIINEEQLTVDLKSKINSTAPLLAKYELFSLGDSLSAAGIWQTKTAELTGCTFDQSKNNKAGSMLSVGGTYSYGDTFDCVLWRTKNLIDQNYISNDGENAIVIFENVNDGYKAFDETVKTIIPTTPIEGYSYDNFNSEMLTSISDKAQLNAVFRLTKTLAGKKLKIDTLPTKAGSVTLRVGWAGPGYSNYNIYVEPQGTDEGTMQHILNKILEYAYTGVTDTLGDDGISIDFCSGNANYLPTVEFTDTDGTGMRCTICDNANAKTSVAKYFIGDSLDEWSDISKWQEGISYSQGWKSSIEMLQRAYPKLRIFVSMFPLHSATSSEFLLANGSYDSVAYNQVGRMDIMRKMQVELKKIADFYSLPFLNVFAECGIGINNMLTFYNASANVHPKNDGYYRFGETVAAQLKRYLS